MDENRVQGTVVIDCLDVPASFFFPPFRLWDSAHAIRQSLLLLDMVPGSTYSIHTVSMEYGPGTQY